MTDVSPTSRRMLSLDALRGFDMLCIMGLEDIIREFARWQPSPVSHALAEQFEHVPWAGLHAYDLIFPLFMFLSGVSIPLSMDARIDRGDSRWKLWQKILIRCAVLVVLGMIYNGVLSDKDVAPRFASVLGQIGIAWAIAASLQLVVRDMRVRFGILFGWLAGAAVLHLLIPVPGLGAGVLTETGAINAWLDRLILPGRLHGGTFDPEGLLCAVSAASVTMAGSLVGTSLKRPFATSWKTVGILTGAGAAAVVMRGPDDGVVGQREQHIGDALIQRGRIARLEVGAAAAVDEQGVAGENVPVFAAGPEVAHAASGVARRVQRAQLLAAKGQHLSVLQLGRHRADATAGRRCRLRAGVLDQLARTGDVVGMVVRLDGPHQPQAVLAKRFQVAFDLLVHRIDDERLAALRIEQDVGEGAGCGIEKLDGVHGLP
ncbi:MAG: DUF5009 domain-containing protein [Acetobacteraceae bacterium]|nr:MAG: DUF5009 domain-containing protein [Acetobacteraceae bacterium]